MTGEKISRRKLLALLGVAGAGGLSYYSYVRSDGAGVRGDSNGQRPPNSTATAGPRQTHTQTPPAQTTAGTQGRLRTGPAYEDIRDYGAKVDGETDDTPAIQKALDAAAPGGTVGIPPGTTVIDRSGDDIAAIELTAEHREVTIRGLGPTAGHNRLVMKPEQNKVHFGVHLDSANADVTHDVRFENLTLDGNKSTHVSGPGSGLITDGSGGRVSLWGCHVKSWMNAGVKFKGALDAYISFCYFSGNGFRSNGGHDIAPNQGAGETTTTIRWTLCTDSGGVSIDVGKADHANLQTVDIAWCILKNGRGSLKISPENKQTRVRNTAMRGDESTTIPVKMNPGDSPMGKVELENVLIDGGGWPGIDFPNNGSLELDEVAIMNVNQTNKERGANRGGIYTNGIDFTDCGRVSIHNVGADNGGDAFQVTDGGGSFNEVIYGGVGDLGSTGDVTIQTQTEGGSPLDPRVPRESAVGLPDFSTSLLE
jgi:hypothetical protein